MREPILSAIDAVLEVVEPPGDAAPVVLDSPHSGTDYPDDFDHVVARPMLERTVDAYVDELFADAPDHGATLISARFPRSYIDPNRAADDLDPDLLDDWPHPISPSEKARGGYGLIRSRVGRAGHPVYDRRLVSHEVRHRIDRYWRPYHDALRTALDRAHDEHGAVWHLNCHSTPSVWASIYPKAGEPNRNDYILGTRDGTTADESFTEVVREHLSGHGFNVAVNDGQKGVELVRAYSDPARGRHSLQLEVNRRLYMDESSLTRHSGFDEQREVLGALVDLVCGYARSVVSP